MELLSTGYAQVVNVSRETKSGASFKRRGGEQEEERGGEGRGESPSSPFVLTFND